MIKSKMKIVIRILLIAIAIMLINTVKTNASVQGTLSGKSFRGTSTNGFYCIDELKAYPDYVTKVDIYYNQIGSATEGIPHELEDLYTYYYEGGMKAQDLVYGKDINYSAAATTYKDFYNSIKDLTKNNISVSIDGTNAGLTTINDNQTKCGPFTFNYSNNITSKAVVNINSDESPNYSYGVFANFMLNNNIQINSLVNSNNKKMTTLENGDKFWIVINNNSIGTAKEFNLTCKLEVKGKLIYSGYDIHRVNKIIPRQDVSPEEGYIWHQGTTYTDEEAGVGDIFQRMITIKISETPISTSTTVTIKLTQPTWYTIEIPKVDSMFKEAVSDATFKVTGLHSEGSVTQNGSGLTIKNRCAEAGTDTITIEEISVNGKYKKLSKSIKIEVTKENKNGYYVATSATITGPGGLAGTYSFTGTATSSESVLTLNLNRKQLLDEPIFNTPEIEIELNKVDSKNGTGLEGATFEVTFEDQGYIINENGEQESRAATIEKRTITTGANGKILIDKIPIISQGTMLIKIKETAAPEYYYTPEGEMVIEITKGVNQKSWSYVVTEVKVKSDFDTNKIETTVKELGKTADNLTTTISTSENNTSIGLTIKNQRKYMKIEGYVWEDLPGDNKLSSTNGKKDSNEQFIKGIEVSLYSDKAAYQGDPTKQSMFTDSTGHYEYTVYMGPEYYVEFNYNGYNYQHTKYTAYTAPGDEQTICSHSTETEAKRDSFNARFGTISNGTTIEGVKISNKDNDLNATQLGEKNIYKMSAYIGPNGEGTGMYKITGKVNGTEVDHYKNLNLGLVKRELADIAVRKDVYTAKTTIKGYSQTYNYNSRQLTVEEQYDAQGNVTNVNKYWDISQRASDIYYDQAYNRDVKASDYKYGTNDGNEANTDKLTLELTYIINVRNQSPTLRTKINQIAEYFDKELTIKEAYIGKRTGEKIKDITVLEGAATNIDGYKAVTLEPDENDKMLEPGTDMFIYLVFNIGELNKIKEIEETGRVYGNLTELMSYSTYYSEYSKAPNDGNNATYTEYKAGDIAGRIDDDSNPGNAKEIEDFQPATEEDATGTGKNREDDADRAPFIRIRIDTDARTTEGIVWEDARTKEVSSAMIGDGLYDKDTADAPIGGITVQLWEIKDGVESQAKIWDQSAKVWKDAVAISSSEDATKGQYTIAGFTPGNYYVKFIYGSDIETAKYNGQDYKSTIYVGTINANTGFDYNNPDANDIYIETQERYSDARDIMGNKDTQGTRAYVNNLYSGEITNAKESALRDANGSKGQIQAKTGKIEIFIEKGGNNLPGLSGINHIAYILQNIDFGLVERPKAQIMLSKEVESAQIVLANGNTLFDVGPNGKSNAMWINKITPTELYKNNLLNYRTPSNNNEAITITMDNESMYGATIIAKYKIVAKNVGEVDYTGNQFYYSGVKGNGELVTTTVGTIIDYPGAAGSDETSKTRNNLRFDNSLPENAGWESYNSTNDADLVAESIKQAVAKYTSTIKKQINKELKPALLGGEDSEVSTTLVLSQVLSNQSDDNSYNNMVELASYVNVVGRRMAYTTVGNQDPDEPIDEIDGDMSQTITILPPFGQKPTYYIIAGVALVILTAGIILIKKKVIK